MDEEKIIEEYAYTQECNETKGFFCIFSGFVIGLICYLVIHNYT
jgi:hypothetical protein